MQRLETETIEIFWQVAEDEAPPEVTSGFFTVFKPPAENQPETEQADRANDQPEIGQTDINIVDDFQVIKTLPRIDLESALATSFSESKGIIPDYQKELEDYMDREGFLDNEREILRDMFREIYLTTRLLNQAEFMKNAEAYLAKFFKEQQALQDIITQAFPRLFKSI